MDCCVLLTGMCITSFCIVSSVISQALKSWYSLFLHSVFVLHLICIYYKCICWLKPQAEWIEFRPVIPAEVFRTVILLIHVSACGFLLSWPPAHSCMVWLSIDHVFQSLGLWCFLIIQLASVFLLACLSTAYTGSSSILLDFFPL